MDFGGSHGQLAYWLLKKGAQEANVVDLSIPEDLFFEINQYDNRFNFSSDKIENLQTQYAGHYDFVFAFTVTEHICDIPEVFAAIHKILKRGGTFFIVHDNYFLPSGAHDNIIMQCGSNGIYEYKGIECWNSPLKCKSTSDIRLHMATQSFPIWGQLSENTCDSENCTGCNFFKRSHPWAHILYRDEFKKVFPEKAFSFSNLNKITPFQLKQHLIEAGFTINLWKRTYASNKIPAELVNIGISEDDLLTVNVIARATK